MQFQKTQLSLIKKSKEFLNRKDSKDACNNAFTYLCSFSNTPGKALLRYWLYGLKDIFNITKIFIKDLAVTSRLSNFKTYGEFNEAKEILIISWSSKKNFMKDGSYEDRYLNINSKKIKNANWFLIYSDKDLPNKLAKNIVLLKREEFLFKYNLFFLLKNFFYGILESRFSFKSFFGASSAACFADICYKNLEPFLNYELKKIIMPYESQLFQNNIFYKIKKDYNNIKTVGFISSPPVALPTQFIYKAVSPDKIILSGKDQAKCFKSILGWKAKQIKILPSLRFQKKQKNMEGFIFLPIDFNSGRKIRENLQRIFITRPKYFPKFKIKNHPACLNSRKHQKLIIKLNKFINKNKNLFSNKNSDKKVSIFIGATGSISEALERGSKTYHLCEDPEFEAYSNKIWNSIRVEKINNNFFRYFLKSKGNLIRFGNNKNTIKQYLN